MNTNWSLAKYKATLICAGESAKFWLLSFGQRQLVIHTHLTIVLNKRSFTPFKKHFIDMLMLQTKFQHPPSIISVPRASTLKSESCHDANFVATGGTGGATSGDKVGIMTTHAFKWRYHQITPNMYWKGVRLTVAFGVIQICNGFDNQKNTYHTRGVSIIVREQWVG